MVGLADAVQRTDHQKVIPVEATAGRRGDLKSEDTGPTETRSERYFAWPSVRLHYCHRHWAGEIAATVSYFAFDIYTDA